MDIYVVGLDARLIVLLRVDLDNTGLDAGLAFTLTVFDAGLDAGLVILLCIDRI